MGFKRIPKSDAEYLHFQRRLHERYGLAFSHKAHKEIVAHINTGAAKFLRRALPQNRPLPQKSGACLKTRTGGQMNVL